MGGEETFPSSKTSRLAVGPAQTRIQWLSVFFSLGVNRPGRDADHSPPSSAQKSEQSCVSTPFMPWTKIAVSFFMFGGPTAAAVAMKNLL